MTKYLFIILIVFLFFKSPVSINAQSKSEGVIQLSGVVLTSDTLTPVPFAHVIIKASGRGTMTDYFGFFSIVVKENDEIVFSAMGFKNASLIISDTLKMNRYSLIQILTPDTLFLKEAVIYPWPNYEQFKKAFVNVKIPEDNYEKAIRNFTTMMNMKKYWAQYPDANANYNNYVYQKVSRLYYAGQLPPNNLLNPFAWAAFFKAWKEGNLKIQKD